MNVQITFTLESLDQLRALERAIDLFVDMEGDRLTERKDDPDAQPTMKRDRAILDAAKQVQKMIDGRSPS